MKNGILAYSVQHALISEQLRSRAAELQARLDRAELENACLRTAINLVDSKVPDSMPEDMFVELTKSPEILTEMLKGIVTATKQNILDVAEELIKTKTA